MRIDRLEIRNFKKFSDFTVDLHPQFTLLVGDNGTGKTSLLDALAIAAGVWLVDTPDTTLSNSKRNILTSEIHLEAVESEGITQFVECKPTEVKATGQIGGQEVQWLRQIKEHGIRTSKAEAKDARQIIGDLFERDQADENIWFPVVAYYGAGRAWLPSNKTDSKAKQGKGVSRRWQAFYGCFEERIRIADLQTWFQKEALAALQRQGTMRQSFQVVKFAILRCIPGADDLWFDGDRSEIVTSIHHQPIPFSNLSAGQKMMVALIADIAIKVVTQNVAFLPESVDFNSKALPQILQGTSGLILIDEVDVHLHPKWQRQVVNDLKNTFPSIQFVCTTHSPIILSEVDAQCIRSLKAESASTPPNALGLDVNRVLDELMGVAERNQESMEALHQLFKLIDEEDFEQARCRIRELTEPVDGESNLKFDSLDPDITRARSLINFLEN